jgi:NAD-dependent deacetylase
MPEEPQETIWKDEIDHAVAVLRNARHGVVFTGAGVSVESGIPPFRGENGIWNYVDPIYLELGFFLKKPLVSWQKIKEIFYDTFGCAEPNYAHYFISRLEKRGIIETVITQNIDNLHQIAGSKRVLELHGSSRTLVCTDCGSEYDISFTDLNFLPPTCYICKGILKPKIVFFNEEPPKKELEESFEEAARSDVLLVIGSDGEVLPAAQIPFTAKENGATIIEINITRSRYTDTITDIFLKGTAVDMCKKMGNLLMIE